MQLLEHFKELTIHPKNAKELTGLILQLAIQGKLTKKWREENLNIEPASILLEKIRVEKEQLIKDKKIKKEKPLTEITEKEIPYGLPSGWEWCRLNEVCQYIQRGKSPNYSEEPTIPVISQKCVQWSGFDISRARFITEESLKKYGAERYLQVGDLLWNSTGDGTIGRVISFPGSKYERVVADSHVTVVRGFTEYILPGYLWIFTASPLIQDIVSGRVSGSTKQTELGTGTVKEMEFSYPPVKEQKAIVEIVNQLFKEVEQLEAQTKLRIQLKEDYVSSALRTLSTQPTEHAWASLMPHFKEFFTERSAVKKLRETVLQLAVQGKLTKKWRIENPDMEHASELLEKIKAEKEQLIKDKKIKKEKSLPPIAEEEIPYELPEGWEWCNLIEVTILITDGKHGNCQNENNSGYYFLSAKDVKNGKLSYLNARQINYREFQEVHQRTNLQPGDLCVVNTGATVGRTAIATRSDLTNKTTFQKSVAVIKTLHQFVDVNYLEYFIINQTPKLLKKSGGSAINNLLIGDMKKIVTPLPSYKEQKAIVEKVNSLMAFCDQLEETIEESTIQIKQLMQSCLKEVFG